MLNCVIINDHMIIAIVVINLFCLKNKNNDLITYIIKYLGS